MKARIRTPYPINYQVRIVRGEFESAVWVPKHDKAHHIESDKLSAWNLKCKTTSAWHDPEESWRRLKSSANKKHTSRLVLTMFIARPLCTSDSNGYANMSKTWENIRIQFRTVREKSLPYQKKLNLFPSPGADTKKTFQRKIKRSGWTHQLSCSRRD